MKYFSGPWANQIVNKNLNGESSCFSNLSFSASWKMMFTKFLLNKKIDDDFEFMTLLINLALIAGCKTVVLCSGHSIWFVKYVLSTKMWFVKNFN